MKRKIQLSFIIIFLSLLFIPILTLDNKSFVSKEENRFLAPKPLHVTEGRINPQYFEECSSYLDDRFGNRKQLLSLNDFANRILGKTLVNEKAMQGKDGWFFYIKKTDGDNLGDFMKKNLMNKDELDKFKERISDAAKWCDDNGIKCIFLICPNKHSVYEEFYPFERPSGPTRADQFSELFGELGIPFVYSRDYIISQKQNYGFPLYYETDTHWNPQGAYLSFTQLRDIIASLFPDKSFPKVEYSVAVDYSMTSGDILPMLRVKKAKSTQVSLKPTGCQRTDLYTYIKNDGKNGVHTEGADKSLPRALIYRDSFFGALEPFVSPLFSESEYIWKRFSEEDKEHVLEYKPDLIIFQAVERLSPYIVH